MDSACYFPVKSYGKSVMLGLALLSAGQILRAADPTTTPAATAPATTRPAAEFSKALEQLSDDDFAAREQAVAKLQAMLLDQTRRQTEIQELLLQLQQSLSGQLKQLALVSDPEAQARAAGLLETQQGVIRWTIEVMKTPPARRKALLAWGLKQPAGALLGKAYAQPRKLRLEGIKELAKIEDDGASWTLGQLLGDRDPLIRAQTMASLWDRKASPDVVASLWNRALTRISAPPETAEDAAQAPADAAQIRIEFPGTNYALTFSDPEDADASDDSTLATAALIHLQSPEVKRRLSDVIRANFRDNQLKNQSVVWAQNFAALAEKYEVKAAIPMLAAQALTQNVSLSSGEINNKQFFWSNRTQALGALLLLAHQNPDDYRLTRLHDPSENGQPTWYWSVPTENEEKLAVKKFHAWWSKAHQDFGVTEKPADLPPDDANKGNEDNNAPEPATAPAPALLPMGGLPPAGAPIPPP